MMRQKIDVKVSTTLTNRLGRMSLKFPILHAGWDVKLQLGLSNEYYGFFV